MRKLVFAICLLMAGMNVFAQKSYISVSVDNRSWSTDDGTVNLTGDIPSDMKKAYRTTVGSILNMLSERGYEVDFMPDGTHFLLSKKTSSSSNAVQRVRANDSQEVTEVARYNLQGLPINANEKGIQIIVFSNYTTKTIIVE